MSQHAIEKDIIVKRVNGIQAELATLRGFINFSFDDFLKEKGFELGQYHLHRALEGVFNISAHILSRIPGGQATKYREMAQKLGEYRIVDKQFADIVLSQMADYRNRLVHFYAEVTPEEIYKILKNNLGDFDTFLIAVKQVLEHPENFGLKLE